MFHSEALKLEDWHELTYQPANVSLKPANIYIYITYTFRAFIRSFSPKWLTVIHTHIHTLMVAAAMQGANQHIGSSLGFSVLPKDTLTCIPWDGGESNQQPSDNKMLAQCHSRPHTNPNHY